MNKILLAEDQGIVITGIKTIIQSSFPEFELDIVKNLTDLHWELAGKKYELAIFGLQLEGGAVINQLSTIIKSYNELRILVYSGNASDLTVAPTLYRAGIMGFLTKEADDTEVGFAIRTILGGRVYISAQIQRNMLQIVEIGDEHGLNTLSSAELRILMPLLNGKGTAKVAAELKLRPTTVSNTKKRIFKKLKVNSLDQVQELMNKRRES